MSGRLRVPLHGDGSSVLDLTMSPVVDRLVERHRVIVIDRRGHGYSDPAREVRTLREQARLVRGAMQQPGIEDPVLVGNSRGTTVVAAYLDALADEVAAAVSLGGEPTVPVLIVRGSADGNVPHADAVGAHELLPTSELRVLDGAAGHELQFTRPDGVVRAIDDATTLARD